MKSQRIQLSRAKGWKMPPNTMKVDRSTRWGNPWRAGMWRNYTEHDAVAQYRAWLTGHVRIAESKPPTHAEINAALRGKNLACWCKPGEPCHADVLLEIANAKEVVERD